MMNMLDLWLLEAKLKMREFFTKENGDVNVVSIVVLIGIAVVLAIVFREAIEKLIKSLLDGIQKNATDAVKKS